MTPQPSDLSFCLGIGTAFGIFLSVAFCKARAWLRQRHQSWMNSEPRHRHIPLSRP